MSASEKLEMLRAIAPLMIALGIVGAAGGAFLCVKAHIGSLLWYAGLAMLVFCVAFTSSGSFALPVLFF